MTSAVCDARMPCFLNFDPCDRPGVFGGTTKLACPRPLSAGSTDATTTWMSAMPPLVIHVFWPLSTHSSLASSYTALVFKPETSEPASGSLTQNAASASFSGVPKHCGTHSMICSGVPLPKIPATPSVVPTMERPMPASPQNSSSLNSGIIRPVGSEKALAMKSKE